MKKVVYIIVLLFSLGLNAQPPGGGGGRGQQNQNRQGEDKSEIKKFKASEVAGIFYYDIEKVVKKLKVKKEEEQSPIKKAIRNYNFKIKEILLLNAVKFSDLDILVNSMSKGKDNDARLQVRKKVGEVVKPIRDRVHENEKELNLILKGLLSEKQFKKWLKYQKKKKESLKPKKPENRNKQGSRSNNSGRPTRRQ
jgi:hypothetical protein